MTPQQVIDHFGGVTKAADALGVAQPTVSEWKQNGEVPYFRQLDIERKTKRKLKADPDEPKRRAGDRRAAA